MYITSVFRLIAMAVGIEIGDLKLFTLRGDEVALRGLAEKHQQGEFHACEGHMEGDCASNAWIFFSWGHLDRMGEPSLVQCGACSHKEAEYWDAKNGPGWDDPAFVYFNEDGIRYDANGNVVF